MNTDIEKEIREKLDAIEQWIDSNAEIIDKAGHSVTLVRAIPETDEEAIQEFIEATGIPEDEAKTLDLGSYQTLTVGTEMRQRCMCLTALVDLYKNGSIDNAYEFIVLMMNSFLNRIFCDAGPIAEFRELIDEDDEDFDTLEDFDPTDLLDLELEYDDEESDDEE